MRWIMIFINHQSFGKLIFLSFKALKKSSHPPINWPLTKTKGMVFQLCFVAYYFLLFSPSGV